MSQLWICQRSVEVRRRPAAAPTRPQHQAGNQSWVLVRGKVAFLAEWLAVRAGKNHRAIHDDIETLGDLTWKHPLGGAYLNRNFADRVAHAMFRRGYSISRRHLSLNDFVLAWRSIIRA